MRLAPGPLSCVSPLESRVLGPASHLWDGFWVTAVWSHQKFRVWDPTFRMSFLLAYIVGKKSWKLVVTISRSSSSQTFFKIRVLKYFARFTGKHSCWSLFLIKLQAFRQLYWKWGSNTGGFLWILRNFQEQLFDTPLVATFAFQSVVNWEKTQHQFSKTQRCING